MPSWNPILLPTLGTITCSNITDSISLKLKATAAISGMPHAVYDTDLEVVRPAREPPVDHEVEEWSNKLKGKKLGETSDSKVRTCPGHFGAVTNWYRPLQCATSHRIGVLLDFARRSH